MFTHIHFINLIIMAQVLVAEHSFGRFLVRREHYLLRILLSSSFCLGIAFLFPILGDSFSYVIINGSLIYITIFIVSGLGLLYCYDVNIWSILFCCITGYTIQNLSSACRTSLTLITSILKINAPDTFLFWITILPTYIICYSILSMNIKKNRVLFVDNKKMLLLSGVAIFVDILVGLFVRAISIQNVQQDYLLIIQSYHILACIIILCIQFTLLSNKQLESEIAIMSHILQEEKKQYQMSKDNIQLINLKCHDLKYQIRKLYRDSGEVDKDALKEIEDAIGIYDSIARTGNDALDVILTEKSMYCEKANISLTCMSDGEKIKFLSASDIYSLFGNALDNAIEATAQLTDPQKRNISMNIKGKEKFLTIHIENYFFGDLEFKDGLPITRKNNEDYHGYGLKSMRMIVEKYEGCLTTTTINDIFHLNILIPIKN